MNVCVVWQHNCHGTRVRTYVCVCTSMCVNYCFCACVRVRVRVRCLCLSCVARYVCRQCRYKRDLRKFDHLFEWMFDETVECPEHLRDVRPKQPKQRGRRRTTPPPPPPTWCEISESHRALCQALATFVAIHGPLVPMRTIRAAICTLYSVLKPGVDGATQWLDLMRNWLLKCVGFAQGSLLLCACQCLFAYVRCCTCGRSPPANGGWYGYMQCVRCWH